VHCTEHCCIGTGYSHHWKEARVDGAPSRVCRDIRFDANISEYEGNIYSLCSKKRLIRLFRIEANVRILHAK
jgi:hypothetical protein